MGAGRQGWRAAGATDVGRLRTSNQDAYISLDNLRCWLVADGMGGHAGGEVASRVAVDAAAAELTARLPHASAASAEPRETTILRAIQTAHEQVRSRAARDAELRGMGTTLVVLAIFPEPRPEAVIGHVGDSRAYLLRAGSLRQITRDHSLVEESLRSGLLTEAQARDHPLRHVLSRAVGPEPTVAPDVYTLRLEPGDRLLLCTDGLTKMLADDMLAQVLMRRTSVDERCRELIQLANERGGEDNITVVIVEWDGERPLV